MAAVHSLMGAITAGGQMVPLPDGGIQLANGRFDLLSVLHLL